MPIRTFLLRMPNPPTTNGCAAQRYLVLMTDGLPTEDLSGGLWPPLGSFSAGNLPQSNPGYGVNRPTTKPILDTITALTNLANAGIKTYIIGMGQATDPTLFPTTAATLNAMAVAGGTAAYYPATSPTDVTNDLQIIVTTDSRSVPVDRLGGREFHRPECQFSRLPVAIRHLRHLPGLDRKPVCLRDRSEHRHCHYHLGLLVSAIQIGRAHRQIRATSPPGTRCRARAFRLNGTPVARPTSSTQGRCWDKTCRRSPKIRTARTYCSTCAVTNRSGSAQWRQIP